MHVVLLILKIIGIVLGSVVGLVLLLLLLLLFCPFIYEVDGSYAESYQARAKVHWLLHFVSVTFSLQKGAGTDLAIRVLGIKINRKKKKSDSSESEGKEKKNKKKKKRDASEDENPLTDLKDESTSEKIPEQDASDESIAAEPDIAADLELIEEEVFEDSSFDRKRKKKAKDSGKTKEERVDALLKKAEAVINKIKSILEKIRGVREKVEEGKDLVTSKMFKTALSQIKREGLLLLSRIRPRKFCMNLDYGMEDPALTGEIYGGITILQNLIPGKYRINPHFREKVLDVYLKTGGHIMIGTLLLPLWRLYRSKEIKRTIKKIKAFRG